MSDKKLKLEAVRWGIIGVGDVCEVKSAPAMQLIDGSSIAAVMRRNGTKAADYAQRHGIAKWYDDADALIADPEVNAIYIATPPNVHLDYTEKAAKAGKPVYVEKPMARTYDECEAMIKTCEAHHVPLFVAYYRRTLPNYLKVKSLLDSNTIGQIRMVEVRMRKSVSPDIVTKNADPWRLDPAISGGGYFYDLASHQLDALDFLFGPIKSAHGYARNQAGLYPAEDIVTGAFEFESGVMGTGNWCFTTSDVSSEDITTIYGSEGEISFPSFGDSWVKLKTAAGEEHYDFEMPKHVQYHLIDQIVSELLGKGQCISTGTSAARTNKVMEWLTSL